MKNRKEVKQWLIYSNNDYNVAANVLSSLFKKPYEIICFH